MSAKLPAVSRRQFLVASGGVAVAGVGLVACGSNPSEQAGSSTALSDDPLPLTALTPAMFDDIGTCGLTQATGEGPFPTAEPLNRSEIHEGLPGHPLRLGLRVIDSACEPIAGVAVDVWHTDATGDYSEFTDGGSGKDEGEGSSFCRGFQVSDTDGIVDFQTIYPGWYGGRAVHIHVAVDMDGERVYASQLYFDEAYTEEVLTTGVYAQFGPAATTLASDRIAGDPAEDGQLLTLASAETSTGTGTLALVNLGIDLPDT